MWRVVWNFNIIAVPAMKKMNDPAGTLDSSHAQSTDLLTAKSVMVLNVPTRILDLLVEEARDNSLPDLELSCSADYSNCCFSLW